MTHVWHRWPDGHYTINYKDPRDGSRCIINTITIQGGVIYCEGIPLKILGREEPVQISLF